MNFIEHLHNIYIRPRRSSRLGKAAPRSKGREINWYKYLICLSFVFLAVALYKANYFVLPHIFSFSTLIASFLVLFMGFISSAIAWWYLLQRSHCHVDAVTCLASVGLSTFSKYIPGKIWTVVGRAAYVAKESRYPLGMLSIISLNEQFITLWVGLSLGTLGLFLLHGVYLWGWLILFVWLGLTAAIFSQPLHGKAERLITRVLHKDIKFSGLTITSTMRVMPWFLIIWLLWSISFYLLVVSLTVMAMPWSVGFGFPLVASLGILALIAPGGLGVREGALVAYLTLVHVPLNEAMTIAVASRLWFFIGEVFIFLVGWIADRRCASRLP